jgi:hypothetical protein
MLVDLCEKVATHKEGLYTGVRKVVQGVTHEIIELPEVDLVQLGYRGGKVAQLMRNYFNQAEVDAARTKLAARRKSPHTSVALNTLGEKKDARSQGHCIRSIIITQTPKWTEVDVIYRSTELIQKHTADYALLPIILGQLELAHTPRIYRLYFANCFLTALFAPILFQHTDPIEFYELLKKHDHRYYRTFLNATAKFYETECRYQYKHRQKMWKIAQEKLDCKALAEYCKMNGASFNDEGLFDGDE